MSELTFIPHRIHCDSSGHYAEQMERDFPLLVRLFYLAHTKFEPLLSWHERLELFMPLDGPVSMRMGETEAKLAPGDLLIVDNLRLHTPIDLPGLDSRIVVISFTPQLVFSLLSASNDYFALHPFFHVASNDAPIVRAGAHSDELLQTLGHLVKCYMERGSHYKFGCRVYLLHLLYLLAQAFSGTTPNEQDLVRKHQRVARLRAVFDFVGEHYRSQITLRQMSGLAGMSVPQFTRSFRQVTGMTFVGYLNQVRLSQSLRLLKEEPISIAEIATLVGFSDQSYFDRRFKAAFHQTPRQFRIGRSGRRDPVA